VLTAFNKAKGIELATRTLSPEMIICDEISTDDEINSILYAFSSGISFALSVHIGSKQDLYDKPIIRKLLETNEFSYVVLLDNYTYKLEIIEGTEILNEINRDNKPDTIFDCNRITFI
jgi:stage III sporulation protein AA